VRGAGMSSATTGTGFRVSCANVINDKPGWFIHGNSGRAAAPLSGGLRCIHAPLERSIPLGSGGNPPPNDC